MVVAVVASVALLLLLLVRSHDGGGELFATAIVIVDAFTPPATTSSGRIRIKGQQQQQKTTILTSTKATTTSAVVDKKKNEAARQTPSSSARKTNNAGGGKGRQQWRRRKGNDASSSAKRMNENTACEPWHAEYATSLETQERIKQSATQQQGSSSATAVLRTLLTTPPTLCNAANVVCALTLSSKLLLRSDRGYHRQGRHYRRYQNHQRHGHDNINEENEYKISLSRTISIIATLASSSSSSSSSIENHENSNNNSNSNNKKNGLTPRQLCNSAWAIAKHYRHLYSSSCSSSSSSSSSYSSLEDNNDTADDNVNVSTALLLTNIDNVLNDIAQCMIDQLRSSNEETTTHHINNNNHRNYMGGERVDQRQQQQQRQSSKLCVTTNSSGGELSMLVWAYAIVRPRTCPPGWEQPRRIEKQSSCTSSSSTACNMDKVTIDNDDFVTFVEFNTNNNDSEEEDTTVDNVIDNESGSSNNNNNNSAEKNNVVHRLFDKIVTTLNVKQCTWSELSNVAWSYATVGVACSTTSTVAMMTSIAMEATDRMKRHAAATTVASTNTSSTQMSNIVRNKSSNNNNILLLPRDAIQIAWALGTMGSDNGNVGHALVHLIVAVHEYWIKTISSNSINRPLGKWTCADLVQMATAMAHGRIDNQMMLLAIYDESLTRLQQQCRNSRSQSTSGWFSITEISILLWTQARLYLTPKFGDVYAIFPDVASLAILLRMDAATAGSSSSSIASSSTQQNNTSTQPTKKKFDNKQFLSIATTSSLKRIGLGPQEQANIAWSLTILANYNSSVVTLLQHIFHAASSFTTNTNADDEKEVDLIQIEHVHQLWQSYFLLSKDCPDAVEYVTNDFRTYLEVKWNMEKSRSKQSSSRHKAMSQTLSLMKVAHRNEYDEDVDVAIVLEEDSAWTHTAVQDFDTDNSSKRWKKVAVEFDGPHHFTVMASTGDELLLMERGVKIVPRVLGHTVLKYRLLKKKGWTVVRIPYYEFDKIPFWASMERQRYLQRALKTHQKIEFSDVDVSEYTPMPSTRNSRFD